MKIRFLFLLFLFCTLVPASTIAAEKKQKEKEIVAPVSPRPEQLKLIGAGIVKEIIKGDMIMLDSGKRFRLDNIRIPPYEEQPVVDALKKELLGKTVDAYTYHEDKTDEDRYGLPLAHIVRQDGMWTQEYLVQNGLVWAYSTETSRQMVDLLKEAEEKARAQNIGIWSLPAYTIKTPENVKDFMNTFQIVQGKVRYVNKGKKTLFINFGDDWKNDFTITVNDNLLLPMFSYIGDRDPRRWKDRIVRIRGWVEDRNGPMIRLTHPEQADVLSDDKHPAPAKAAPVAAPAAQADPDPLE